MDELQHQWLNTVRMIDRLGPEKAGPQIAFRNALTAEWGKRAKEAARNPGQFAWPSTKAAPGAGNLKSGDWHVIGMLSYLGYRVGAAQGEKPGVRHQILDTCFSCDLPPINGPAYLAEWGAPATASRLKKLAHELASFIRNAKRKRSANLSVAIDDWEEDLSYLYETYYVRRFGFSWPRVELGAPPPRT
ncbi:MAG: hypothetical protein ACM3ZV_10005 [Bacillota bacterium]